MSLGASRWPPQIVIRYGARMTSAQRLAHVRSLGAAAGVVIPFVAGIALHAAGVPFWAGVAVNTSFLVGGAVCFVYFVFRWKPACPECHGGRAKFVRDQNWDEYLVCDACGMRARTGYTYNAS